MTLDCNCSAIIYFNTNFHELIINYWNGRKSLDFPIFASLRVKIYD